jgi:uncharacterized membrane protein YhaH (DUF805 family)
MNSAMAFKLSDLWDWHGTVGRGKYAAIGIVFFAIKHNIDRLIASAYGRPWSLFNYWIVNEQTGVDDVPEGRMKFYAVLVAVAVPFVWTGVVLTLKRLRSAGLPLWLVALFFVPFLNFFFFLLLCVVPPRGDVSGDQAQAPAASSSGGERFKYALGRIIPDNAWGSAAIGVLLTVLLSLGATMLSVRGLGNYGWGLFVGLPFFLGLCSSLIHGIHRPRDLKSCLGVSMLSVLLVGGALMALAVEGIICLVMAAPLAFILALCGGAIGYVIQRRPVFPQESFQVLTLLVFALPSFMGLEYAAQLQSPLYEVRTAVTINAPPDKVWQNLVAFGELAPPRERIFRTGIAYPIRAEIQGRGVGAVRYCVFSTGAFVEPIEVWDEPRLLRFGVTAQPPVMNEMSPYDTLRPPHLEGYLQSKKGQFLLTTLPDGRTRLEGTTWYENRFWPGAYWHVWSDQIIHRIHLRVLEHIKQLAERDAAPPSDRS